MFGAGAGRILSVTPGTGDTTILANNFPAGNTLNALTFDSAGNGYVTDSNNGAIYMIPSNGGSFNPPPGSQVGLITTWSSDPLLQPPSNPLITPPFGANGIEFLPPGCNARPPCVLMVANTGNRQIIRFFIKQDGSADMAGVYVNGVNGPDGIAIDASNNIWVSAGQSDEIVVIRYTSSGQVIGKLGDYNGLTSTTGSNPGAVIGLLFPASIAFSNDRRELYVANLASPNQASIDSSNARQVLTYTISKLRNPLLQ
jgi:sugar lactone lactonase YvrE